MEADNRRDGIKEIIKGVTREADTKRTDIMIRGGSANTQEEITVGDTRETRETDTKGTGIMIGGDSANTQEEITVGDTREAESTRVLIRALRDSKGDHSHPKGGSFREQETLK